MIGRAPPPLTEEQMEQQRAHMLHRAGRTSQNAGRPPPTWKPTPGRVYEDAMAQRVDPDQAPLQTVPEPLDDGLDDLVDLFLPNDGVAEENKRLIRENTELGEACDQYRTKLVLKDEIIRDLQEQLEHAKDGRFDAMDVPPLV